MGLHEISIHLRMCGRFTYNLTWEQIVAPCRLTSGAQARNPQPRFNIPPTTTVDTVFRNRPENERTTR